MLGTLRSRRLLVTGGSGFLGSHLCDRLRAEQPSALVTPRSSEFDLRDASQVRAMFDAHAPEVVFHLAASVGGIGANRAHPGRFFYDNMAMGLHVIEEARRHGTPKVVVVGTVCSYPKFTPVPFVESDLWNGYPEETNAPYGIAKKALLVMAQAYRQEYGTDVVMPLPVNLYGPRDNFDLETSHVIPAMIRKLDEARRSGLDSVSLWGDGSPTREFLFVRDAVDGIVRMAERYDGSEPVNLGTGREIAMRDLALLIARETGFEGRIEWDTSRPNGQPRRALDVSVARRELGFEPRTSLEEGIHETVQYFRDQWPRDGSAAPNDEAPRA